MTDIKKEKQKKGKSQFIASPSLKSKDKISDYFEKVVNFTIDEVSQEIDFLALDEDNLGSNYYLLMQKRLKSFTDKMDQDYKTKATERIVYLLRETLHKSYHFDEILDGFSENEEDENFDEDDLED